MFYKTEDLRYLAETVIEKNERFSNLLDILPTIGFQYCDKEKKKGEKVVYAETEKVPDRYKAFIPYNFIITFFEPQTSALDEDLREKLMYHELLHVGYDGDKMWIVPHDIEDFRECVEKWGLSWIL